MRADEERVGAGAAEAGGVLGRRDPALGDADDAVGEERKHALGPAQVDGERREVAAVDAEHVDPVEVHLVQLVEARAYGADAVLLIAAALDAAELADLLAAARQLGLGVLVEVHDDAEVDALDLDAVDVLGVNSRDLRTFEVDLSRAEHVFARLPERIVRVAESGIRTAQDAAHLRRAGADAFLVGTHFMRQPDPGRALATLRRETALALAQSPIPAS